MKNFSSYRAYKWMLTPTTLTSIAIAQLFKLKLKGGPKNNQLMKMTRLTIVQREPVSPCIAMEEGGFGYGSNCQKTG